MDIPTRQPRKWTFDEDEKLREEVEAQLIDGEVKDWCRIADQLPGRTNKDCRKRWHNSVAGGLKKGQWSKSEDEMLRRGVDQHGQRWTLVASGVGSRSADQCAKRWQQSLDPDLDRSEWRDSEDQQLIDATRRLGRHWKDIQREHFPGRSKNDIKNRYTVLVRRYQNRGIILPSANSSPSESSTPAHLSSYADDDDYFSPINQTLDGLLAAPSQASSHRHRNSWSSMDNDSYATWSTSQEYNMPMAIQTPSMYQSGSTLPGYPSAHPHTLAPTMSSVSSPLDWTGTSMDYPSPSIQTSPTGNDYVMDSTYYTFNQFPDPQPPIMNYNSAYTAAPIPPSQYTAAPSRQQRRPSSTRDQQAYQPDSTMYRDPRYPHNSPYGY